MADFPVTTEQFEDDPPVVVVNLRAVDVAGVDCDGFTLTLSPDAAAALAVTLTAKAAAIRRGLPLDITYTDGDTP